MMFSRVVGLLVLVLAGRAYGDNLGGYWDTAEEESKYYKIVEIPIPEDLAIETGSFEVLSPDQLAIGTRRGDIFLVRGAFDDNPTLNRHRPSHSHPLQPQASLPSPRHLYPQDRTSCFQADRHHHHGAP
ncbi:MAG: hypothetical protein MI861_11250, partial [Pirellulales bacterium]|nr:hypothetical protein [Pirellulales bacterium]